jgi:hypothetical protein
MCQWHDKINHTSHMHGRHGQQQNPGNLLLQVQKLKWSVATARYHNTDQISVPKPTD